MSWHNCIPITATTLVSFGHKARFDIRRGGATLLKGVANRFELQKAVADLSPPLPVRSRKASKWEKKRLLLVHDEASLDMETDEFLDASVYHFLEWSYFRKPEHYDPLFTRAKKPSVDCAAPKTWKLNSDLVGSCGLQTLSPDLEEKDAKEQAAERAHLDFGAVVLK